MTTYNVGDKVKVFDRNSSKMGQPEGGWDGEIVKTGSKYVHIAYRASGTPQTFMISTRKASSANSFRWFLPLAEAEAQAALAARQRAVDLVFSEYGLQVKAGVRLPIETQEEVAATLLRFPKPGVGES